MENGKKCPRHEESEHEFLFISKKNEFSSETARPARKQKRKKVTNNRLVKDKKQIAPTTAAVRAILQKLYYELFFWRTALSFDQRKIFVSLPILQKYPLKKMPFSSFSAFVGTTNGKNEWGNSVRLLPHLLSFGGQCGCPTWSALFSFQRTCSY